MITKNKVNTTNNSYNNCNNNSNNNKELSPRTVSKNKL